MVKIYNWQMYMPKCYFLSRKCKNRKINTFVHHIRVKFVDKSPPSPKWYNRYYGLYWCMDHCFLVFIKKIYTIIMCLYYIDLLYDVICYTISHSTIIYYIPIGVWWAMSTGVSWSTFCNMYLPTGVRWAMNGVNWAGWSTYPILFGSTYPTTAILYKM